MADSRTMLMMCTEPGCSFQCGTFAERVQHMKDHGIEEWSKFNWTQPAAPAPQAEPCACPDCHGEDKSKPGFVEGIACAQNAK